jgi:hypothetical protein
MATIGAQNLTFTDWARRLDPSGATPLIVEMLGQANPIVQDAAVVEGNLPTGHVTTMRTGLPAATYRALYEHVQPSKSTTKQVTDTCAILEAFSEIDEKLLELNGDSAAFRASEDRAFLDAMNIQQATTLFYGNVGTTPREFHGLTPRFNTSVLANAENATQVIKAGGAGTDNTSMWFLTWSEQCLHAIFPKGSKAGFMQKDLGIETKSDANGGLLRVARTQFRWENGLCLRDWRYHVRIANIDVSELADAGEAAYDGAALIPLMIRAYNRIYSHGLGRQVIYCNRSVMTALDNLANVKTNVQLSMGQWGGQPTLMFRGWPIRTCDALRNDEALVP